jgi:diacylglycerol kinase (ATP)
LTQSLRSQERARSEARRAGPFRDAGREAVGLVASFNFAFEGLIYVVRTQRNMRVHFVAALLVLLAGLQVGVSRVELLLLMLASSFVLVAEMVNTAIEKAIDVATGSFDPVARVAKDVAAGAVLVAAVNAAFVGYLVFASRLRDPSGRAIAAVRDSPVHLTVIAVAVIVLLVVATKAATRRGTPLRGGLPSGHAAVAFGGWAAVTLVTAGYRHQLLVSTLAFLMAVLVAQTRVEARIHTTREVLAGAVLGALVMTAIFQTLAQ